MTNEPDLETMLRALATADREGYEAKGNVISNPDAWDLRFRRKRLDEEEANPGMIRSSYLRLVGQAPRRHAQKTAAVTELDYSGGLAATLLASIDHETGEREWTDDQIIQQLIDADDISDFVARRALEAARPHAAKELANRAARRKARVMLADRENQPAPTRTILPRLVVAPPEPAPDPEPVDDLDDDAIWNQEPA